MSNNNKKCNSTALSRLRQDYMRLKKDPVPYILAEPMPNNILEWHYLVCGPPQTPYEGGIYHGKLKFPPEFPFRAPSIYLITPSGRFKTNTRLCLSISDFHQDTWNPAWSVGTILTGLLSFMLERSPTLGSIESTEADKRSLAIKSIDFNLKDKIVAELFPESYEEMKKIQQNRLNFTAASSAKNSSRKSSVGVNQGSSNSYQNVFATFLVGVGFVLFAISVTYVLRTISNDQG